MSDAAAARPLSLSYYTVPELSPPDMVRAAAGAGFASVGLRLLHGQPGRDLAPLLAEPALQRATSDALRAHGLTALDASSCRLLPDTNVEAFAPMLDVAAAMGVRHVHANSDDPDEPRRTARLARLAQLAHARGLTIDIEFVPWMALNDLAAARRAVTTIDHPALGITIDALHFHRSHGSLAELGTVAPSRLRLFQLCDAPAAAPIAREDFVHEATKERLLPGDGAIDLRGLLRALPPDIAITLEIPMTSLARNIAAAERLMRGVRATRNLLASVGDGARSKPGSVPR